MRSENESRGGRASRRNSKGQSKGSISKKKSEIVYIEKSKRRESVGLEMTK
jgi:hypothetical protein